MTPKKSPVFLLQNAEPFTNCAKCVVLEWSRLVNTTSLYTLTSMLVINVCTLSLKPVSLFLEKNKN